MTDYLNMDALVITAYIITLVICLKAHGKLMKMVCYLVVMVEAFVKICLVISIEIP